MYYFSSPFILKLSVCIKEYLDGLEDRIDQGNGIFVLFFLEW